MQLDQERFEQRVAQMVEVEKRRVEAERRLFEQMVEAEKRRLEQIVEAEKRRVEEELAHFKTVTAARREQAKGWAALRPELLEKVFAVLQAAGRSEPLEGGSAFSKAVAVVREVCTCWQAVHDAAVKRLVFKRVMTDEAVGMLVRRYPATTSVQFKTVGGAVQGVIHVAGAVQEVTDVSVLAVCSSLPALTSLHLNVCRKMTDVGVRAVSSGLPALTELNLSRCDQVTDEAVFAVCSMPALRSLNLSWCTMTDHAVFAVSSMPALTQLNLSRCEKVTDAALRAVSSMPALAKLNLSGCSKAVTDAALRAVSSMPALTKLNLRLCSNITDAGVLAVSRMHALTYLNLHGCRITHVALQHLGGLKTLTSLSLSCGVFSWNSRRLLRRQLPGLVTHMMRQPVGDSDEDLGEEEDASSSSDDSSSDDESSDEE